MIGIKIEKLCNNTWLRSHAKFCRIGDRIRINDIKDREYRVISMPIYDKDGKDWDLRLERIV